MRLDMLSEGFPKWWIRLIVFGNVFTVITGALLDYIKRLLSLVSPFHKTIK
ncbi:MAG: hypothetical protein KI790_13950 [Cyclobacteriaceae bacterium]|nr:hypothetical protein [Cyclobacteriaceae bacterium HetDA_MAG_MS6]